MRKVDFRTVVVASAVSAFFAGMPPTAAANETMTVTVTKGGLQSFGGFGMHKGGLRYKAEVRDTVNALIIKPLHVTFIRFYVHGSSVDSILADFDTLYGYPDGSTMFDDFLKQNPKLMFLLAQAESVDTITGYEKFCAKWAKAARKFGEEKRVPISWIGITSEPNVGNNEYRRIALELYPDVVKGMRAALDAEGLESVKIYIPEVSNVDSIGRKYVGVTKADAEAWKCVDGLITKAYNMNADMYYKRVAQESQLPYFVAAGANLINFYNIEASNDNDHYAAEMAARMFNDFNHMVSHWGWYLPAEDWLASEPAHRIVWYFESLDEVTKAGLDPAQCMVLGDSGAYLMLTLKYHYLKHIARAFDLGCRFRFCVSDPARPYEDMWWTFGQKPAICASAAMNQDTTWTIGVVNATGCMSDTLPNDNFMHLQTEFTFYDAATYDVTVKVEELAEHQSLKLALYRSNKTKRMAFEDSVTMEKGECTVTIAPKEMVTLRGAKGKGNIAVATGPRRLGTGHAARAPFTDPAGRVVVPFQSAGRFAVELLTLRGRTVCAANAECSDGPLHYRIPSPALAPGMYVVRVLSANTATSHAVFVRD